MTQVVRAKFRVESVLRKASGGAEVQLNPVTGGSAENDAFYKWTPSGKIELSTVNPRVADLLPPGSEVYVDFTPVLPAPPPPDQR